MTDATDNEIEQLRAEIERLKVENDHLSDRVVELEGAPWPEWSEAILKAVREHSGYDGYDDAENGVDLPQETEECLRELASGWERDSARASAAEARCTALEALALELAERLEQWESATNHATTHLSPSGVVVKRDNKAFLLNNMLLAELRAKEAAKVCGTCTDSPDEAGHNPCGECRSNPDGAKEAGR